MDIITPDELPPVWREFYESRAAVREFDGGQAREHAEAEAFTETIRAWRGSGAVESGKRLRSQQFTHERCNIATAHESIRIHVGRKTGRQAQRNRQNLGHRRMVPHLRGNTSFLSLATEMARSGPTAAGVSFQFNKNALRDESTLSLIDANPRHIRPDAATPRSSRTALPHWRVELTC